MRCWRGYLSGARCRLFAYGPADATASQNPSLASFKSRLVLPFWYQFTQVVLEKRLLNGCSVVVVHSCLGNAVLYCSYTVIYTYICVIMWMKIVRCLKYLPYMVYVLSLHFRQLQAALYSIIMSIGLNTVTSLSEMCHSGQIISICKYMYTCMCNCHNIAR